MNLCLAIETSCDETAVALLDGRVVLSEKVASQIKAHQKYGGVMPECASRLHTEVLQGLIETCLKEAKKTYQDLDCLAVTQGPGLEGSLLVGVAAAKSLAAALKIPLYGMQHICGHICSAFSQTHPKFPFLALVVSGGHTLMVDVSSFSEMNIIARSRDDACGEAFDKVARMLGLTYPGGPIIEKKAREGQASVRFPRPMLKEGLDFSFSGLKTAVSQYIEGLKKEKKEYSVANISASFQEAVREVLITKTKRALEKKTYQQLVLCGGVFSNAYLRAGFDGLSKELDLVMPKREWCTDNAVMIGLACSYLKEAGLLAEKGSCDFLVDPNLVLGLS